MAWRPSPRMFRIIVNLWPPFRGAGIRVRFIASDWSEVRVELREQLLNRNFVGTHFGGSLFAMTDPFYMLMLLHTLGGDYIVWDQAAEIEYLKPGRGTVVATCRLTPGEVDSLKEAAKGGARVLRDFPIEVRDADGAIVARVVKRLYVRQKKRLGESPAAAA